MTTPDHLGGSVPTGDGNTHMPDIAGYLVIKYDIRSVIDIGSGYGHALKVFHEMGIYRSLALDGDPVAIERGVAPYARVHDFSTGPYESSESYDLAWSTEFLEHVDEKFMPNYMASFQRAKYACVTHALPGQGGHHHVNEQPTDYWVEAFNRYGFDFNAVETAILRRTDRWKAAWGRRTLTFFENRNPK